MFDGATVFERALCGQVWEEKAIVATDFFTGSKGTYACCSPGTFIVNPATNACGDCPAGLYSDTNNAHLKCPTCSVGFSSSVPSSGTKNIECKYCPPGRTLPTQADPPVCEMCVSGKYQTQIHLDTSITCSNCDVGMYIGADYDNDDSKHDAKDDCEFCPPGKEYIDITKCE